MQAETFVLGWRIAYLKDGRAIPLSPMYTVRESADVACGLWQRNGFPSAFVYEVTGVERHGEPKKMKRSTSK